MSESILRHDGVIKLASIPVHHFQCLKGPHIWRRKQRRYARLALKDIARYPRSARLHLNVGQELFSVGNRDQQAIRHLRRAAALRPDWPDAHACLAMVYQTQGRTAAALGRLRTALQLEPGNADFHCLVGRCQLLAGRYEEALASLRQALTLRREHPVARHLLGVTYESLGAPRKAIAAYQQAVDILPVYQPAVADLRRLARRLMPGKAEAADRSRLSRKTSSKRSA